MATVSAVYDGTLELLGVVALGSTPSTKNTARMTRAYNQIFSELKETGLATWASAGTVPDEFVPHLEALMAFNACDTYSVSPARYERIVRKESVARREIRRLSIPDYESLDEPVDF